jgi:hypothetical protein
LREVERQQLLEEMKSLPTSWPAACSVSLLCTWSTAASPSASLYCPTSELPAAIEAVAPGRDEEPTNELASCLLWLIISKVVPGACTTRIPAAGTAAVVAASCCELMAQNCSCCCTLSLLLPLRVQVFTVPHLNGLLLCPHVHLLLLLCPHVHLLLQFFC